VEFTSRQIRAFLLVAQHRSFSRAAQAFYITPSGLSLLIRELETQLGFRLFDRTTRHVALTASGAEFLPVAQKNLEDLDATVARIGRWATEASHFLSVGTTPLVAANVMPQALKEFRGYRPDLHVHLFEGDNLSNMQRVESGKLDIGLGVFSKPARGIVRTPFFRFSLMVVRADHDPGFRRASTTWSALAGETLVSLHATSPIQQVIDRHLAKAGVVTRPGPFLNLLDTQIAMVEAGEGVAVIPSYGLPLCRNRKVVMSRLINPVVNMEFHQIRSRGKKLPPGAHDFTAFLKSYITTWAGRSGVL
jgi:DNA-binding transcriptional LysR family regulator